MAFASGQNPAEVYRAPYALVLYGFWQLQLIERQEEARRAVESEELVNGMAYAFHEPPKIKGWAEDLRKRVGLLARPKADRRTVLQMAAKLAAGQVTPLGPDGGTT